MLALETILDVRCCGCGHDMGVTVKCAGDRLADELHSVVRVRVPCPNCDNILAIYFSPSGTVHNVSLVLQATEPSYN